MIKLIFRLISVVTLCFGGNIRVHGEGNNFLEDGFFESLKHHVEAFEDWAIHHSKNYKNDEEKIHRMSIWVKNHELIEEHNSKEPKPSFLLGHNHFSDLTNEEFRDLNHLRDSIPNSKLDARNIVTHSIKVDRNLREGHLKKLKVRMRNLPPHVNWVKMGAVTPVKNQGKCGACWAFSTTGAIEGAKFIKTQNLTSLSEQNLIDCDGTEEACKGGLMSKAFKFDTAGLCSEKDYPYEMKKDTKCNPHNCTAVPGTGVKSYIDIPEKSDIGLRASISLQPTSIAISTKSVFFQLYRSGVFDHDACGVDGKVDHGVLAVGYGHDAKSNLDYYLIKNSWGPKWGDSGYIRVARSIKHDFGMCSILRVMTIPILKDNTTPQKSSSSEKSWNAYNLE